MNDSTCIFCSNPTEILCGVCNSPTCLRCGERMPRNAYRCIACRKWRDPTKLNIAIVNVDTRTPGVQVIYVNRGDEQHTASPLANLFFDPKRNREWRNFNFYRVWLWRQIKDQDPKVYPELLRLLGIAKTSLLILGCHCATQLKCEQRPVKEMDCHAEIIAAALRWLAIQTKHQTTVSHET